MLRTPSTTTTADTFDIDMFMRSPGDKAYAGFMRGYDAEHTAQHPKQKAAAMKLPASAEIPEGQQRLPIPFHLSVKYCDRTDAFHSAGYCNHAIAEDEAIDTRFACRNTMRA